MTRKEKRLQKAKQGDISYQEFLTLLRQNGWVKIRHKGSHAVWQNPRNQATLPVQPNKDGSAKQYQVADFFKWS